MNETRFFVELPVDREGNRAYTNSQPAVIEAVVKDETLWIIAPREIVRKWSSVLLDGWMETTGPARLISREERERIIHA